MQQSPTPMQEPFACAMTGVFLELCAPMLGWRFESPLRHNLTGPGSAHRLCITISSSASLPPSSPPPLSPCLPPLPGPDFCPKKLLLAAAKGRSGLAKSAEMKDAAKMQDKVCCTISLLSPSTIKAAPPLGGGLPGSITPL